MHPLFQVVNYAVEMHNASANPFRNDGQILYVTHLFEVQKCVCLWGAAGEDNFNQAAAVGHDLFEDCGLNEDKFVSDLVARDGHERNQPYYAKVAGVIGELSFLPVNLSVEEKRVAKDVYMNSFADKSIWSLIDKCADRLKNTYDFLLTDKRYAGKYLHKGEPLWRIADARHDEIVAACGEQCYYNIFEDRKKLLLLLQ